jgi:hypothetical protein
MNEILAVPQAIRYILFMICAVIDATDFDGFDISDS